MNAAALTTLIGLVFVSQLLVLSVLVPVSLRRTGAALLRRYPPAEFPRLYPVDPARTARFDRLTLNLNYLAFGIGVATLLWSLQQQADALTIASRMFVVLLAQYVPLLLRVPFQWRLMRTWRAMPPPTVRSADLRPWRVTDHVPIWLVGVALAVATTAAVVTLHGALTGPRERLALALLVPAVNLLLLARMLWLLSGRATLARQDPYMADADVFDGRRSRVRMLFRGALLLGSLCLGVHLYNVAHLPGDRIWLLAALSVVLQLVWLASAAAIRKSLAERDMSVYRSGA